MKGLKIVNLSLAIVALFFFSQPDEVVSLPLRLLVFGVCFGLVFLLHVLQERKQRRENAEKPIATVRAKLVGRRTEAYGSGRNRRVVWFLAFKPCDGGEAMEFEVSEAEASRYDMGEEALLQYQGWQYLGFRRYIFEDAPRRNERESTQLDKQKHEADNSVLTHELEE